MTINSEPMSSGVRFNIAGVCRDFLPLLAALAIPPALDPLRDNWFATGLPLGAALNALVATLAHLAPGLVAGLVAAFIVAAPFMATRRAGGDVAMMIAALVPVLVCLPAFAVVAFGIGALSSGVFVAACVMVVVAPFFLASRSGPVDIVYVAVLTALAAQLSMEVFGAKDGLGYELLNSINALFDLHRAAACLLAVGATCTILALLRRALGVIG